MIAAGILVVAVVAILYQRSKILRERAKHQREVARLRQDKWVAEQKLAILEQHCNSKMVKIASLECEIKELTRRNVILRKMNARLGGKDES